MPLPIESLESRTLLAATLTGGVLTVTGTDQPDNIKIFVSRDGTKLVVKEEVRQAPTPTTPAASRKGVSPLRKTRGADDAKPPAGGDNRGGKGPGGDDNDDDNQTTTEFTLADVDSIVVNAGAGNDQVTLRGRRKSLLNIPAAINGGADNDHLRGGSANDVINGDGGNDKIEGNTGNDNLSGGDGNDVIVGGLGDDVLSGGNGNDQLVAADRTGKDTVDGGAHDPTPVRKDNQPLGDRAVVDSIDTVSNVERTVTPKKRGGGGGGGGSRK